MKINLVCNTNTKKVLTELLHAREITVVQDTPVCLVERGAPISDRGISIVFDPLNLDELIDFLDNFGNRTPLAKDGDVLVGKKKDGYELLKTDEVIFFEADGNYTYCQTGNSRFEIKKRLYELEESLASRGFIRISKSALVNILKIKEIIPWFGGRLLLKFKEISAEVEVSRNNVQLFKKYLDM